MNLVSIIIPFKNPGKYFKPCLESIRNQSYPHIEVLLIDDHSKKEDVEVARMVQIKDERFQLHRSNGKGIINALQTGLDLARGEFISRMDADDLMTKDKIELMHSALLKSNQKSVCTAFVSYFASEKEIQDGFKKYENWLNKLTAEESNFTQIYKECTIPSPCWMARKLDIQNIGGFKGLTYPEDYDLDIYMWTNSDGDQLKDLFKRISKIKLSDDATELMNISILTNAYSPQKNITKEEFSRRKEKTDSRQRI